MQRGQRPLTAFLRLAPGAALGSDMSESQDCAAEWQISAACRDRLWCQRLAMKPSVQICHAGSCTGFNERVQTLQSRQQPWRVLDIHRVQAAVILYELCREASATSTAEEDPGPMSASNDEQIEDGYR